jgi:hypothetical protein
MESAIIMVQGTCISTQPHNVSGLQFLFPNAEGTFGRLKLLILKHSSVSNAPPHAVSKHNK